MARGRLQLDGYAPAIPLAGLASRKVDFRPHFDTARAEEPQSRYYRGRLRRTDKRMGTRTLLQLT